MNTLTGKQCSNFTKTFSFASYAAFNEHLEASCRKRQDERLRGHDETIGERLKNDLAVMLPLPAVPYDACAKQATRVSSLSLVR